MGADNKEGYASLRAARVLADMPGGEAFLHVLTAHGFNQISKIPSGECCSIDRMVDEIHSYNKRLRQNG